MMNFKGITSLSNMVVKPTQKLGVVSAPMQQKRAFCQFEERMNPPPVSEEEKKDLLYFSRSEIREHKKPTDFWVIKNNRVYNITGLFKENPQIIPVIGEKGGQDTTEIWDIPQMDVLKFMLPKYKIGWTDPLTIRYNEHKYYW